MGGVLCNNAKHFKVEPGPLQGLTCKVRTQSRLKESGPQGLICKGRLYKTTKRQNNQLSRRAVFIKFLFSIFLKITFAFL